MDVTGGSQVVLLVACGVLVLAGVLGSAVKVVPGPLLVAAGVLVWAVAERSVLGWVVLGVVVALLAAGQVLQYLLAGKRLKGSGIPRRSIAAAVLAGVVGFFVVPVVGLFLFFVLGLYLAELARLRDPAAALPSTRTALGAIGVLVLVELTASLLAAGTWLAAVLGPPLVARLTG
jgi:hypothetical protein